MKVINKFTITSLLASTLVGCGSGSSGSGDTPTPPPPSAVSVGLSTPGKLFGIDSSSSTSGSSAQAILPLSAIYNVPLYNSSPIAFQVISVNLGSNSIGQAISAGMGTCSSILPSGASCNFQIGFAPNNVVGAENLNGLVSLTYSTGQVSEMPVTASVVEPGNLEVDLPSVIAPNADGYAYGTITVFNGTADTQSITGSDIAPEAQEGVTWTFTPNCDGNGGNTIASLGTCSVGFVYKVDPTVTQPAIPAPINIAIPIVNTVTNQTTVTQRVATSLPPAVAATPRAYLAYNGGVVSLSGSSASFTISNVGNGVLSMINVTGLTAGVTQTNTCNNVAANGVCTVTLSKASGATVPASITVEGIGSVAVNSVNISVSGQQLAVSPVNLNFGANYTGATQQRVVTISNTGATALTGLSYLLGSTSNAFNIVSNNCTGNALSRFASCQVTLGYTAPAPGQQANTLTVGAATQENVSVALSATSLTTSWTNLITSAVGYTDTGASIISLISAGTNILFGNSMPQHVAGARHIWSIDTTDNDFDLEALTGMTTSAPTAIAYNDGAASAFIGKYDGTFYTCNATTDVCTSIGAANPNGFGVTSAVQIDATHAFAGLSDKSTGTNGALWYYNGTGTATAIIPNFAVGKMALSGSTLYAPLHTVASGNSVALVAAIDATTGAVIGQPMQVSAFTAGSGEYFTVLYVSGSTIYGGTNLGNVYSSPVSTLSAASWTKSTITRLSTSSVVTALAVVNNQLYVGLGTLGSSAVSGGALYTLLNNSFTKAQGYSDNSSVSALSVNGNNLYVGTYGGNIWKLSAQ